jgi:hypothetical protein
MSFPISASNLAPFTEEEDQKVAFYHQLQPLQDELDISMTHDQKSYQITY